MNLEDFQYHLPDHLIARQPLAERSASKLLVYDHGRTSHHKFTEIDKYLSKNSLLIFNDTKVIQARMYFRKDTGALIEVFLLEPVSPSPIMEEVMKARSQCTWKCMVGNAKKWKPDTRLTAQYNMGHRLYATRNTSDSITFEWSGDQTFSEVITAFGSVPLPPYLNRDPIEADKPRYQTVYSRTEGAVAAPTAGLHFDTPLLEGLKQKGIKMEYVTLHVSAGTFQPIKSLDPREHPMHREQIVVRRETVKSLLTAGDIVCVGTTSLRTLESLFWFGVKLMAGDNNFFIEKNYPYQQRKEVPSRQEVLGHILEFMHQQETESLIGHTEIFIIPGYQFRMCSGLITNFHLPKSTLILLVAALVGEDWKNIYQEAIDHHYRFLSYGDTSLLIPKSV